MRKRRAGPGSLLIQLGFSALALGACITTMIFAVVLGEVTPPGLLGLGLAGLAAALSSARGYVGVRSHLRNAQQARGSREEGTSDAAA